jgi:formylglycine-generating enzyme required for sulfatase activity
MSASDGGSGGAHPSCEGLPQTCGPFSATVCCDPLQVPGGTFDRSYDAVYAKDDTNPATVSAFALDRFEVTVGRFRRFVDAGGGVQASAPPLQSGAVAGASATGWTSAWTQQLLTDKAGLVEALKCLADFSSWTDAALGNETRPINCVTWYEAQAFCIWDGGRLATEAEWNFVAAAGSQQRVYPWSSPATADLIDTSQASYYVDDHTQCYGDGKIGCSPADLVTVGSKTGESLWGHFDLSGNVREWVYDYFAATFLNPCVDCVQTTPSPERVMRGGGFETSAPGLTASERDANDPLTRAADVGFRCAYGL